MVIHQPVTAETTRRRGFTLTEAAIVLGIVGLILGAIWVAAAAVYNNMRVQKANTALLTAAQTVRSLHATQNAIAAGTEDQWVAAGVWPTDWVRGTTSVGPWGTTGNTISLGFSVVSGDAFKVVLTGVPAAACIDLLVRNTGAGRDSGLYFAGANSGAANATQADAGVAWAAGAGAELAANFPVTVAEASASCSLAQNNVVLGFRLKT
jgi:Tfp pilus assembly protein PilE